PGGRRLLRRDLLRDNRQVAKNEEAGAGRCPPPPSRTLLEDTGLHARTKSLHELATGRGVARERHPLARRGSRLTGTGRRRAFAAPELRATPGACGFAEAPRRVDAGPPCQESEGVGGRTFAGSGACARGAT